MNLRMELFQALAQDDQGEDAGGDQGHEARGPGEARHAAGL